MLILDGELVAEKAARVGSEGDVDDTGNLPRFEDDSETISTC